jgi:hypothetical protein
VGEEKEEEEDGHVASCILPHDEKEDDGVVGDS